MALNTEALMQLEDVKTFFVSKAAMTEIENMLTRTREVYNNFGGDSPEYTKMADSLAHCLTAVLTRTGFGMCMSITADGDLSLLCNENDAFVFGMVFFRDRNYEGHPAQPGEWSLHS